LHSKFKISSFRITKVSTHTPQKVTGVLDFLQDINGCQCLHYKYRNFRPIRRYFFTEIYPLRLMRLICCQNQKSAISATTKMVEEGVSPRKTKVRRFKKCFLLQSLTVYMIHVTHITAFSVSFSQLLIFSSVISRLLL